MGYTMNRNVEGITLDEADARTRAALTDAGFGVLTEIDVQVTMKKKLGLEPRVGAMLPCNVILREVDGGVEISAIDPVASMQAIDNPELLRVAAQVRDMLARVVENA